MADKQKLQCFSRLELTYTSTTNAPSQKQPSSFPDVIELCLYLLASFPRPFHSALAHFLPFLSFVELQNGTHFYCMIPEFYLEITSLLLSPKLVNNKQL